MEMESSACVQRLALAGLASRALGTTGKSVGSCAILRAQLGKNKIHSIELALVHVRGKYLFANALSYLQPATTMRDMLLLCRETAQRVAVFGGSPSTD